jgi:hypothetical protein
MALQLLWPQPHIWWDHRSCAKVPLSSASGVLRGLVGMWPSFDLEFARRTRSTKPDIASIAAYRVKWPPKLT